jgi:DNA-binding beta-propeller fold protein YncE
MRAIVFAAFLVLASLSWAQPALKVTQLAELADVLSQPHDAAFSPDGKLIYLTDMRNSRVRVLEAMTLKPVGVFGEGELSYPHDDVWVIDTYNDRIVLLRVE